jgi:hypothetical protein
MFVSAIAGMSEGYRPARSLLKCRLLLSTSFRSKPRPTLCAGVALRKTHDSIGKGRVSQPTMDNKT